MKVWVIVCVTSSCITGGNVIDVQVGTYNSAEDCYKEKVVKLNELENKEFESYLVECVPTEVK